MHVIKEPCVVNVILITRVETEIWLNASFNMGKHWNSLSSNTSLTVLEALLMGHMFYAVSVCMVRIIVDISFLA